MNRRSFFQSALAVAATPLIPVNASPVSLAPVVQSLGYGCLYVIEPCLELILAGRARSLYIRCHEPSQDLRIFASVIWDLDKRQVVKYRYGKYLDQEATTEEMDNISRGIMWDPIINEYGNIMWANTKETAEKIMWNHIRDWTGELQHILPPGYRAVMPTTSNLMVLK